jgi:8-oxo-dGTP pyrophosphatase MutT (NUDIX family)
VRAVVLDAEERTFLMRYGDDYSAWWVTPGGGAESDEMDEQALRRELHEELGLTDFDVGPLLWTRESWFGDEPGHCGQRENVYLVRVPPFEAAPASDPAAEGIQEQRWFTLDELGELPTRPRDLAERIRAAAQ